ncbi:RNA polymerase sigma factor [Chryseobacterium wanjuense]|nr:sigma-70 family RNA polymerase sigma factor [Chryseobacterium wanjuense]
MAFQSIFYSYYQREINYAFLLLDEIEDARDIGQLTFLQFWQLAKYSHIDSFTGYIRRMTHTNCLRTLKERASFKSNQAEYLRNSPAYEKASFDQAPELKAAIEKAIDSLRPSHRMAFQLYYIQNMRQKDGAEMMGVTTQNFKNYIHLAVANLRTQLSSFFDL